MRRLLGIGGLFFMMTGAVLFAAPGNAQTGSASDPDDIAHPIDAKALTHADDGTTITLTMEAYETWGDTDEYELTWNLYYNDDDLADARIFVRQNGDGGPFEESGLYDPNAANNLVGPVTASKSGAIVTVTFPQALLQQTSFPLGSDTNYGYRFDTINFTHPPAATDSVPDVATERIVHTLGGTPTTSSSTSSTSPSASSTSSTSSSSTSSTSSTSTTVATTSTTAPNCGNGRTTGSIVPTAVLPGERVTYTDNTGCFAPNATLSAVYRSDPVNLGTVTADASGRVSAVLTIPQRTLNLVHTITLTGTGRSGGVHQSVASVTVTRTGVLAVTASNSGRSAPLGVALIGAGALMLLTAWWVGRREELRDWGFLPLK